MVKPSLYVDSLRQLREYFPFKIIFINHKSRIIERPQSKLSLFR